MAGVNYAQRRDNVVLRTSPGNNQIMMSRNDIDNDNAYYKYAILLCVRMRPSRIV
jgi:hypothetical protein